MKTNQLNLYFKNKTAIQLLYGLLFALSIVVINPWGGDRAEIWTQSKLSIIQLIIILNLLILLPQIKIGSSVIPTAWKIGFSLWSLFLGIGIISTLLSPSPWRSVLGQIEIGDGLIYWCFTATFIISNALVMYVKPDIARYQLYGLFIGGIILALAIFIQVYDWRIDFTATSRQISELHPQLLKSRIWKIQMPVGFYTNRGEAAFVLVLGAIITLLGLLWGWISPLIGATACIFICTALFYTQCRGAFLGLFVALIYLLISFSRNSNRRIILLYGIGLSLVSYFLFKTSAAMLSVDLASRPLPSSLDNLNLNQFSSRRLEYLPLAIKAIVQRPWFGWGFDGFALAFPHIADWTGQHRAYLPAKVGVSEILSVGNFSFKYLGIDGAVHTGIIMITKVHNLILDTAISVGILGLISYFSLFGFFIWCAINSTFQGIEATAIAYLVYTLTWYESGQFSHLGWWGLSIGLGCTKLFQKK